MYYLKKGEKILGPFKLKKLQAMVDSGQLIPEYLLSEDKSLWIEASKIKELFPELIAPVIADDIRPESKPKTESELKIEHEPVLKLDETTDSLPEKSKRDIDSSAENSLPEKSGITVSNEEEKEVCIEEKTERYTFVSALWNPVKTLPVLYEQCSKGTLAGWGVFIYLFSYTYFFCTLFLSFETAGEWDRIVALLVIAGIPHASLSFLLWIFIKLSAENRDGAISKSFFFSALALMPTALLSIVPALLSLTHFFSAVQMIVIVAGLGIYAFSYMVLLLFNGLTRVFGINGGGTVFLVSSLILLTSGLTAFFMKLMLSV
jgi:hypothetical protein